MIEQQCEHGDYATTCKKCKIEAAVIKSCPFCGADGSHIDPKGWMDGDGKTGPECMRCGTTTVSMARWQLRDAL